jgi:hypothetical protein
VKPEKLMDINAYRRKIEQSVAKEQTRLVKASARKRAVQPDLRELVSNKKTAAKTRVEALGRLTREEGPDAVPQTALDRLSDPKESPAVRLAAIKLLQQRQFSSPIAPDWRPAFVEALRVAVSDRPVRAAALEVLSTFKDRPTQELLLEGLRKPKQALVPVQEALRLLSTDIHADVIDVAKKLTKTQQKAKNNKAVEQAVRILAADPGSVGTLKKVLANDAYAMEARRVAATAISNLAPEALPKAPRAARAVKGAAGAKKQGAKKQAAPKDPLARHIATLRRIRE